MTSDRETAARTDANIPTMRLHYLDLLRAVLMLVGIPYHAALAFSGRAWGVTSHDGLPALGYLVDFTHIWRMPTFFVIAGLFAGLMASRRGPMSWFRGRLKRVGVPLAFGLLIVSPTQLLVLALANRARGDSLLSAWIAEMDSAATWVGHLWFLLNLLIYCALFALIVRSGLWAQAQRRLRLWADVERQSDLLIFVTALSASALVSVVVAGWNLLRLSGLTNGVVGTEFVSYGLFFVGGLLLALSPSIYRMDPHLPSRPATVIGITLVVLATTCTNVLKQWDSPISSLINVTLVTLAGWYAAGLLFALAMHFMRSANSLVTWLVDASLTIYIFHHPLILLGSQLMIEWNVPPLIGFLGTSLGVFVASAVIYEVLSYSRATRWLSTGSVRLTATLLVRKTEVENGRHS